MPSHLTPEDVHNVAFRKPSLGRRGYDEEEVDAFLDAVEKTIAALTAEIETLRAQLNANTAPGRSHDADDPVLSELKQLKDRVALLEAAVLGDRPPTR